MDDPVKDVVDNYFCVCIADGELMGDDAKNRWITENIDGQSGRLDDRELIDMADEGVEHYGSYTIEGKSTVRQALEFLAFYAIESKVHQRIQELVDEHELAECGGLSDSAPFDHDPERIDDDDLFYWRSPRWAVWKQVDELGLWADFTSDHEPTAVDRLAMAGAE